MSFLQSIKPFWPMLFTFILPRAINYYRALKIAYRTRPPPRPLTSKTSNSLNTLFGSIIIFLLSSIPNLKSTTNSNIFTTTNSRLHIPTDILFARLALLRPNNTLTPQEEDLRSKLTTPILRKLYLRFGPETLLNCSFCHPDDEKSYLLYHLPVTVLLPHLFHFFILGLATSETISGFDANRWRFSVLLGAAAMVIIDTYLTATYDPLIDPNMPSPQGVYWTASLLRPLILCLYDVLVAFTIYASSTGRFLLFPSPGNQADSNPELVKRRTNEALNNANIALRVAQTKLRALGVVRNAVVRDEGLKEVDDTYWKDVVIMEDENGLGREGDVQGLWEDEEVQAAMARAYGAGSIDVSRIRKEAEGFVGSVTHGLESNS